MHQLCCKKILRASVDALVSAPTGALTTAPNLFNSLLHQGIQAILLNMREKLFTDYVIISVFHNVRLREVKRHAVRVPRRDGRLPAQDPAQVPQLQGGLNGGGAPRQTLAGRAHRPGTTNHASLATLNIPRKTLRQIGIPIHLTF